MDTRKLPIVILTVMVLLVGLLQPAAAQEGLPLDYLDDIIPWQAGTVEIDTTNPVEAAAVLAANDEWELTDPTAWWWYYGQTASQVSDRINDNQARLVDIEVESLSPLRFTIALVKNSGAYAKGWWWYYNVTPQALSGYLDQHQARILDLEVYELDGQVRVTAILVPNTGDQGKSWWWYYNVDSAYLAARLDEHNARLIDLETHIIGGQRTYSGVMIANQGADAKGWWWYYNITAQQVSDYLQQNNARLIDIERHGSSTFTVVMQKCPCPHWWWYYNVTPQALGALLAQNGARLIDIETHTVNGQRRFNAIMVNNVNAITTRVRNILMNGTDGATGLYLKEVGGPVLASLQQNRVFEPASTIKALYHLFTMQRVQTGASSLNDIMPVYDFSNGSCPGAPNGNSETLRDTLKGMMRYSDNNRTKAIAEVFGLNNINALAGQIGMSQSQVNHHPGCGGPQANALTLADAGRLYEGVADGSLLNPAWHDTWHFLMAGKAMYEDEGYDFIGIWEPALGTIVDEEAPNGMTAAEKAAFQAAMDEAGKAGGYTLSGGNPWLEYRSFAGWARVPVCVQGRTGSYSVQPKEYVFGFFIDGATSGTKADATFNSVKAELLREQIHVGLSNWSHCAIPRAQASHSTGAPGSTFSIEGSGFAAGSQLALYIQNHKIGDLASDWNGGLSFLIKTSQDMAPGSYEMHLVGDTTTAFTLVLAGDAPLRVAEFEGTTLNLNLPDGAGTVQVFLPSVMANQ